MAEKWDLKEGASARILDEIKEQVQQSKKATMTSYQWKLYIRA